MRIPSSRPLSVGLGWGFAAAFLSSRKGSRKVKAVPSPGWLSAEMLPPIWLTSSLTMDIPRPVPLYWVRASADSWVKGLNSWFSTKSRLMPMPVSVMRNSYHTVVPSQESSLA